MTLREQAEALALKKARGTQEDLSALTPEAIQTVVHNLLVHQIELEMQNEELRQAQVERDAAQARYVDLYDQAPVGYCTVAEHGLILQANLTAAALLGVKRDALVGLNLSRFILSEDQDIFYMLKKHTLISGSPQHSELRLMKRDGPTFWADVAATAGQDEAQAKLLRIVLSDISERKASEEQLRKLSLAVEQSPESIVITNLDARIEYVNDNFMRVTGYSREEILGQNPSLLHSGETPVETYKAMWAALSQGQTWKGEFFNRRKDGSTYTEFAIITPLRQSNGLVTHYVAIKEDITEKKRLGCELDAHRHHLEELVLTRTAELTVARDAADAANRAKSSFLANMSHEIRTPMNGILGMAHLLRRTGVNAQQMERLDKIDSCGQHLLSIVNDVLDLAKIDAGKTYLEEKDFLLDDLLSAVRAMVDDSLKAKGLTLCIDIDGVPSALNGDVTRLRQALANYLSNAAKFTDQGSITIQCRLLAESDEGYHVRFAVIDTGIGLTPEQCVRLFHPFEQADNSITRRFGGTGLGLVLTRSIAQLMGGKAGVDSVPGQGSTFWITAHLKKPQGQPMTAPPAEVSNAESLIRQSFSGVRVLLVDDEPINLEIAQLLLADSGLNIDVARDGQAAINMAKKTAYKAIFMDMQMPKVDGLEATRQIRQLPAHQDTTIIAMTANAFSEDRERCIAAGMNDFLMKPFDPDVMFTMLLHWLSKGL